MSGLILGALGQGLASFGNSYANLMVREADREDRQEERRRELEERRAYEEKRDALYRRTADQQNAGRAGSGSGGGSDGISIRSMAEGGEAEEIVAGRAGMTVPELRRLRQYRKDGNPQPFGTKVKTLDDEYGEMEATAYPEGLQQEVRAKMQTLARIEESYALGGKYDDVTKGRRNQQTVDATDMALRKPGDAGLISQAVGAGDGKPLVDVKDGTAFNQYTGANSATEKGKSEIDENKAQAEKYRAEARKLGQEAKEALKTGNIEKLSTMLTSLNKFSDNMFLSDEEKAAVKDIALQVTKAIGADVNGRTGGNASGGGKAQQLKVGDVHDGMRYKGGNPNDRGSWEAASETKKPAKVDSKPDAETPPTKPERAARSNIETMSTSDLQRIAKIDGHVSQAAAKQELERRRQMWEDERSRSPGSAAAFMP